MIDLTAQLNAFDTDPHRVYFDTTPTHGGWTPDRLRSLLDRHKLAHVVDSKPNADESIKYKLTTCPVCGKTEGNPAAWVLNGHPIFKCHRMNECAADFAKLQQHLNKGRLEIISAADLPTKYMKPREDVVVGLLRRGDVANLVGGPKSRKSFFSMQLALSVASGVDFLGWPTKQGRVVIIDNELALDDLASRMMTMVKALQLDWPTVSQNIDLISLRGKLADITAVKDELTKLPIGSYSLLVADALYKLLGNIDENANGAMTTIYVAMDTIATEQGCGVVAIHHHSKGSQSAKSVTDCGAGAGAQSRSADLHCVLRDHEAENTVVMEAVVRSQPPIKPKCLQFIYPIWTVAADKDPSALATPGKKPSVTLEQFLDVLPTEPTPKREAFEAARDATGASVRAIQTLAREAKARGLIVVEKPAASNKPHTVKRVNK